MVTAAASTDRQSQEQEHTWFDCQLGISLLRTETNELGNILPNLYGKYLVKIDGPNTNNSQFLKSSQIDTKIYLTTAIPLLTNTAHIASKNNAIQLTMTENADDDSSNNVNTGANTYLIQCHYDAIPLLPESIDVVIIHHALEFSLNPRSILEEAYQILAPNGNLIIIGFNPLSMWGLKQLITTISTQCNKRKANAKFWRLINVRKRKALRNEELIVSNTTASNAQITPSSKLEALYYPWHGRFIGLTRLNKWLQQLNFTVTTTRTFYFLPPSSNQQLLRKMAFLEKISNLTFAPQCGACYILRAQKNIFGITPIRNEAREISKSPLLVSNHHY